MTLESIRIHYFLYLFLLIIFAIFCISFIDFSQLDVSAEDTDNTSNTVDSVVQVHESNPIEIEECYYTDSQYQEYPHACEVWKILRENGYNAFVAAGILGNMMTECGGQTLNLQYNIYDSTGKYYGLCQWALKYTPQVNGLDVNGQMDLLLSNIKTNIEYFGGDFNYFMNLEDEVEAAKYFQNYYERGAGSFSRSKNATTALQYFTTEV